MCVTLKCGIGCVGLTFIAVIVAGAIRAVRYPERYGPMRRNSPGSAGLYQERSRAQGLGRAILESFPIVKFGTGMALTSDAKSAYVMPDDVEMKQHNIEADPRNVDSSTPGSSHVATILDAATGGNAIPPSIGRDTCPVCIVDFEEDDDLRVLPCKGRHAFHPACVDPWLLTMSSSCPVCRQDFNALDEMMASIDEPPSGPFASETSLATPSRPQADMASDSGSIASERLPRYLKFIRRKEAARSSR